MKKLFLLAIVATTLAVFGGISDAEIVKRRVDIAPSVLEVTRLRSPEILKLIGKRVEFEGFFYNGSIPMLLDKMERVQVNLILPDDAYIPIVGRIPAALKSGDKISIKGTLTKGGPEDPKWAARESAVIRLSSGTDATVISRASSLKPILSNYRIRKDFIKLLANDYAVLIVGGWNAGSNHLRYWNELKATYTALKNRGLTDDNIYVVYADGTARDNSVTVDYSATKANILTAFNAIAGKSTKYSNIYIMTNDHGGGFSTRNVRNVVIGNYNGVVDTNGDENDSLSEATYNIDMNSDGDKTDTFSIDETLCLWGEQMTDDEFAVDVNKITKYSKMIIQMEQCFSGGFVSDLAGPNRVIMSACGDTECSWAKAPTYEWNEFTFAYLGAWTGTTPAGSTVNADTNGDNSTSMMECFNFARANDNEPETPMYEDDGQRPGHSGQMPSGGEGTLGSNTAF